MISAARFPTQEVLFEHPVHCWRSCRGMRKTTPAVAQTAETVCDSSDAEAVRQRVHCPRRWWHSISAVCARSSGACSASRRHENQCQVLVQRKDIGTVTFARLLAPHRHSQVVYDTGRMPKLGKAVPATRLRASRRCDRLPCIGVMFTLLACRS